MEVVYVADMMPARAWIIYNQFFIPLNPIAYSFFLLNVSELVRNISDS